MSFAGTERFELRRQLGQGGMGVVYEAYDRARDMRVALKTLRRLDANALLRFKREFRALSDISHPNIIRLHELVSEGRDWFFSMEFVDGEDLVSYVSKDASGRPPHTASPSTLASAATVLLNTPTMVDAETAATMGAAALAAALEAGGDIGHADPAPVDARATRREPAELDSLVERARMEDALGQLAQALHALHEAGLVHCDVKPANVMVTPEGRVVLMDFGVAAATRLSHGLVQLEGAEGTPAYMAPEQALGQPPSAAADWYAFGVTLYLLLAGRLPFESETLQLLLDKQELDPQPPSTFTSGIPPALEALCMRLLARDPAARPRGEEVLAVLGVALPRSGARPRAATAPIDGDVLVGRAHELAALYESYHAVYGGEMRCVLVGGPSGMGKSSLLLRFLHELRAAEGQQRAPLVLMGRCRERESLTYKAFDGLVDQLSLHLQDLPVRRRRAVLPEGAPLLARLFPVLRRVKELAVTTQVAGGMELRAQAVHILRALLAALAREQPIVAYIDDLQWADSDSLDLLDGLLAPPAPGGLLLLATLRSEALRPGEDPALARLMRTLSSNPACRHITLAPLSADEQAELVAKLGAERGLPAAIDDALLRQAAGHPMLLTELVRHAEEATEELAASGALSLEDVIWRRVANLPAVARALVEIVAVSGEPMPLGVLASAVDLAADDREQAHAIVRSVHLARVTRGGAEPWLDAYHAKMREAVLQHLDGEQTRALHGRLAQAMEAWEQAPVASLARHWLAAGATVRAVEYLLRTAHTAAEQLAFARVQALYRSAVQLLDDAPQDAATDRLRCQAWLGLAQGLRLTEDTGEALRLLAHAEAVAELHEWYAELADIHHLRGNLLFARVDLDGCMEQHTRACAYARRIGSVRREAAALGGLGDAYVMRGRSAKAHEHYGRCIELSREHGFEDIAAANLPMLGLLHLYRNDIPAALRAGAAALALAARSGHARAEVVAITTCLGRSWLELGWPDVALPYLERGRKLARSLGSRRFEAGILAFLARALDQEGRHEEAEATAGEALALMDTSVHSISDLLVLGALASVTQDRATRAQVLARAEAVVKQGTLLGLSMLFYRDAIDIALADGDYDRMERFADALEALTRAEPTPWSDFVIARARALAAFWRGRRDAALVETIDRLRAQAWQSGLHLASKALAHASMTAAMESIGG